MATLTGIDILVRDGFRQIAGRRVGLMTNHSGVTHDLRPTYRVLHEADAVNLVALFGPEHGVFGMEPDGEKVASGTEPLTGLPVHSLYGDDLRPTPDMLAGLDAMLVDIQDVGARFYTYLWTVSHLLEGCGAAGVAVIVLDRPNPIGDAVEGPGLDPAVASFVGRYDIPIRHGMTLGELARMLNATVNPTPAELDVIACDGYSRAMTWADTGLPFVPPSPAMPHPLTAMHYPGACLIEGVTLSEGRGTGTPFEVTGAPFIQPDKLADALNILHLPGVRWRPHRFVPDSSKHAGTLCGGVQVHITDASAYQPVRAWLHVIATVRELYPDDFGWRPPFAAGGVPIFDRLVGSASVRAAFDAGASASDISAGWDTYEAAFRQRRADYLLYG